MLFEALVEFIEANPQGIRADTIKQRRHFREELDAAELANIIVKQSAVIQMEYGSCVLAGRAVPQQFACHAQVDVEDPSVEIEQDLFAATADAVYHRSLQCRRGLLQITTGYPLRKKLNIPNCAPERM